MNPRLDEIILLPVDGMDTTLALASPLFRVESINTAEARIQSASTDTGNTHTVEKFALESFVGTKISRGELVLIPSTPTSERVAVPLVRVQLLLL